MESGTNNGQRPNIMIGDILSETELSQVNSFFKKKDLKGARAYLNEPERKKRLMDNGVVADYLYYQLEFRLMTTIK